MQQEALGSNTWLQKWACHSWNGRREKSTCSPWSQEGTGEALCGYLWIWPSEEWDGKLFAPDADSSLTSEIPTGHAQKQKRPSPFPPHREASLVFTQTASCWIDHCSCKTREHLHGSQGSFHSIRVVSHLISAHPLTQHGSADTLDFDLTAWSNFSLSACSKRANKYWFPEVVL